MGKRNWISIMKKKLFFILLLLSTASYSQILAPKGIKVGAVTLSPTELIRLDGSTATLVTTISGADLYNLKSDNVSATTYFYRKEQVDTLLINILPITNTPTTSMNMFLKASNKKFYVKSATAWVHPVMASDSINWLYGNELVTNGSMASSTSWALTNSTITGGVASVNCTTAYATFLVQDNVSGLLNTNKTYKIEFDVTAYTSGSFKCGLGSLSQGVFGTAKNAAGHYNYTLTLNNTLAPARVTFFTEGTFVGSIDNVSVKVLNQ